MVRLGVVMEEQERASPFLRCICRTTYLFGRAARRMADLVGIPRAAISRRFRSARGSRLLSAPHPGVGSRRSRLAGSLHALERMLVDADGGAGLDGSGGEHRGSDAAGGAAAGLAAETLRFGLRLIAASPDEDASLLILEALHHREPGVRCAAAEAAAEAGAFAAVFSLILLLDDPVLDVRKGARAAITRITHSSVDFDPLAGAADRKRMIETLKSWWKTERFSRLAAEVGTGLRS